jgi:hypothetical protein
MRHRLSIILGLLVAVACCAILPHRALSQVRLFWNPEEKKGDTADKTVDLPLRDIQAGRVDVRSAATPCKDDTGSDSFKSARAGQNGSKGSSNGYPALVQGVTAPNCVFKDVVAIVFYKNGLRERCSGVRVSDNAILTAAHCACGALGSYRILTATSMKATDGEEKEIEKQNSSPDIYYLVDRPAFFAGYRCDLQAWPIGRDLALLRVATAAELAGTVTIVPVTIGVAVATPGMISEDGAKTKLLIGAGFGYIDDGSLPNRMQYGAIPIASLFCGQEQFAGSECRGGREFVLAARSASSGGTDTCGGDSGGPIFYAPDAKSVTLVGITSRAVADANHRAGLMCGRGGIYTTVGHPAVVAWLRSNGINVQLRF